MDRNCFRKFFGFFKKETVLVCTITAALISALFNPPSAQYLGFIDVKVLLCLFCLMITVAGFKKLGAFEQAASYVAHKSRNMRSLALGIILLTFFSAMIMTNDVALITLVPFTLILLDKIGENEYAIPVIVLQTIGANIGSSLTPVGNPQNLYLFSYYKIPLGEFSLILLPIVLFGGLLLGLSTLLIEKKTIGVPDVIEEGMPDGMHARISRDKLRNESCQETEENRTGQGGINAVKAFIRNSGKMSAFSVLFILSVLAVFNLISIEMVTVLLIVCVLLLDRRLFLEIDYSLLVTFVGFFIFVGNLSALPAVRDFLSGLLSKGVFLISLLTSQFISNVPSAVLLSGFTSDYRALLLGVDVGGMGTLIASLASVISYKLYTQVHPRSAKRYLKIFTGLNLAFLAVLSLITLVTYLITG